MDALPEPSTILGALYGDGFLACKGAFPRAAIEELGADIDIVFEEARRQPGGVLPRGPNRFYVEIHPERLRGFATIATHPWVTAVCAAVLGPDYRIIEVGFDIPGPGAQQQPWHRDFFAPPETVLGRRLNSLAFNITTVDVSADMGPFEIAPGTQWDTWEGDPMFPPAAMLPRYEARAQRKLPMVGDISARSALTVHRGTANHSQRARPVFVLGVDAPDARNGEKHDLQVTHGYYATLPEDLRHHLGGRVVERLEPIEQAHTIEGLVMGAPSMGGPV
jgi:hypothetical protein